MGDYSAGDIRRSLSRLKPWVQHYMVGFQNIKYPERVLYLCLKELRDYGRQNFEDVLDEHLPVAAGGAPDPDPARDGIPTTPNDATNGTPNSTPNGDFDVKDIYYNNRDLYSKAATRLTREGMALILDFRTKKFLKDLMERYQSGLEIDRIWYMEERTKEVQGVVKLNLEKMLKQRDDITKLNMNAKDMCDEASVIDSEAEDLHRYFLRKNICATIALFIVIGGIIGIALFVVKIVVSGANSNNGVVMAPPPAARTRAPPAHHYNSNYHPHPRKKKKLKRKKPKEKSQANVVTDLLHGHPEKAWW